MFSGIPVSIFQVPGACFPTLVVTIRKLLQFGQYGGKIVGGLNGHPSTGLDDVQHSIVHSTSGPEWKDGGQRVSSP